MRGPTKPHKEYTWSEGGVKPRVEDTTDGARGPTIHYGLGGKPQDTLPGTQAAGGPGE